VAQKKISAALTPVNYESWSITTTLSSASADSVCCWACRDQRSTTGRCQCVNRHCGSWPGSTLSTWRITAVAAAGWSLTWPDKGSRSAATVCQATSGFGPPATRKLAHPTGAPSGLVDRLIGVAWAGWCEGSSFSCGCWPGVLGVLRCSSGSLFSAGGHGCDRAAGFEQS
jgi:hypothetical protein